MIKKTFQGREEYRSCSSCRGLYIICKPVEVLKFKRFTVIGTRLEKLTKNRCSQYNDNGEFTKRVSVVGEGDVVMSEKMMSGREAQEITEKAKLLKFGSRDDTIMKYIGIVNDAEYVILERFEEVTSFDNV